MPLFDGLSLEADRRGSNPRPSEPQSADTCFWGLPNVAESPYLSPFLCARLPVVAAYCALSGVSSGVKRHGLLPARCRLMARGISSAPASVACGLPEGLREDGVEVELLYEGPPVPYPDLAEDVLEMILHRVLGDVEGLGDLLDGGPAYGQADHFLLAGA